MVINKQHCHSRLPTSSFFLNKAFCYIMPSPHNHSSLLSILFSFCCLLMGSRQVSVVLGDGKKSVVQWLKQILGIKYLVIPELA